MIHGREAGPMPAHVAAELKILADQAEALAESINRMSLHAEGEIALVRGNIDTRALLQPLIDLRSDACIARDKLEQGAREYKAAIRPGNRLPPGGSDGGARKKSTLQTRKALDHNLIWLYCRFAQRQTVQGKKQFLQTVAPRRRGR